MYRENLKIESIFGVLFSLIVIVLSLFIEDKFLKILSISTSSIGIICASITLNFEIIVSDKKIIQKAWFHSFTIDLNMIEPVHAKEVNDDYIVNLSLRDGSLIKIHCLLASENLAHYIKNEMANQSLKGSA